ncbi:MAG: hypothetical protein ACFNXZ_11620 [Lautropia mirabilis]
MLVNNAAFDECVQLRPEMFFHIGHQVVWQAICDMVAANIGDRIPPVGPACGIRPAGPAGSSFRCEDRRGGTLRSAESPA